MCIMCVFLDLFGLSPFEQIFLPPELLNIENCFHRNQIIKRLKYTG